MTSIHITRCCVVCQTLGLGKELTTGLELVDRWCIFSDTMTYLTVQMKNVDGSDPKAVVVSPVITTLPESGRFCLSFEYQCDGNNNSLTVYKTVLNGDTVVLWRPPVCQGPPMWNVAMFDVPSTESYQVWYTIYTFSEACSVGLFS